MVRANNENRKELRFKVKTEVPFNPEGPPLGLSPEKTRVEETQAGKGALTQYSQKPRRGSNQNVHQQRNGQRRSGPCTQWNISRGKQ